MKDKILSLFTNPSEMTPEQIVLNIGIAAVLGFFIFISYYISHRGTIYSKKFNASLVILAALTGTVMTVIGNNIALSLGMVGALSIVRFRTAIKDSRDTVYIFWSIIVGICCGVSYYALAAISTGMIFLVMLVMGSIKANDRYLLIIHANREDCAKEIENTIFQQYKGQAVLRVANRTTGQLEYIYELTSRMLEGKEQGATDPVELLRGIDGVYRVNLVCQNEEMSR